MILQETYTLADGNRAPKIAFGTWQIPNEQVGDLVTAAIGMGYRHIDTAAFYENEAGVAEGIRNSGIPREEIFITTKIPGAVKSFTEAQEVIGQSLENLQTDYIDLMLIHCPRPIPELFGPEITNRYYEENSMVYKAMEIAHRKGQIRSLGVSSFDELDVQSIWDNNEVPPVVNQIMVHIGGLNMEQIEWNQSHGLLVQAFSPSGTGAVLSNPTVVALAEKYACTPAQLAIRFDLQLGVLPLPRTTNLDHMKDNANVDFFEISAEDMDILKAVPFIQKPEPEPATGEELEKIKGRVRDRESELAAIAAAEAGLA